MYSTIVFVAITLPSVLGHGFLADPPARNSMWRDGFETPKNYNDMGLNCGGFWNQWNVNDGRCGLCGDSYGAAMPRDHEAGGKYAPTDRPISRCYDTKSHVIDITVRVTAYHKGYFEFLLCENNDMSTDPGQACVDNGHLLNIAGIPDLTRYDINEDKREYYDFQLDMPMGVVCTQCILRWKYNAGNNWGCDEEGCGMGKGEQEQFINCADIAIVPDCDDSSMTTESVTDDTDSESGTIFPPTGGFTSQGPTVTGGGTSGAPTVGPTGGPAFVCYAIGEWVNKPYMDGWCMFHCLNPALDFCPATHCRCEGGQTARVW